MPGPPPQPPVGPTHLELWAIVERLYRASLAGDCRNPDDDLRALRLSLADHFEAETEQLNRLSAAARAVVRAGQRRLLDQIDVELQNQVSSRAQHVRVTGTRRLVQLVRRQVRLERGLLEHRESVS